MNENTESASTPTSPPGKANEALSESKPSSAKPSLLQMTDWLKFGSVAYAAGFAVIMVHTARLDAPVVEALEFQNVVAGLPILLALGIAIWLTPWLLRPLTSGDSPKVTISKTRIFVAGCLLLAAVIGLYFDLRAVLHWQPSTSENWLVFSALVFISSVSMFAQAYQKNIRISDRLRALFRAMSVYSGVILLVLGYAILGYPRLPQGIGGGHSVRVTLYFKDPPLALLLGGSVATSQQPNASGPLDLYYRTGSYLLLAKAQSHRLIQVPTDQVLAVEWLDSNPQ
jgi:hypothetical protein